MSTTVGLSPTRLLTWRLAAVGLGLASLSLAFVQTPSAAAAPQAGATTQSSAAAKVARGEYLATRVAMCIQCHSPRDGSGAILMAEKFRGGTIPFKSPWPNSEWAYQAPSLAGLPGFTDEQIVTLLSEGRATGRPTPRSPMPAFRMSQDDATAIAAYLRSF
jgi:mono/diheme cytochrome c family protein